MDHAPFTIQKLIFTKDVKASQASQSVIKAPLTGARMQNTEAPSKKQHDEVELADVKAADPFPANIPGYFAMSTAPANIEDNPMGMDKDICCGYEAIAHIAQRIYDMSEEFDSNENPELVVTIHGYNTSQASVEDWFKNIFTHVNRVDSHIKNKRNVVFLGYRWSSENIQLASLSGIINAILALPVSPRIFLRVGFIFSLVMLSCMLLSGNDWVDSIFLLGLVLSIFSSTIVITLVILRLVVYFRDVYRATNFGVPDLVELLRKLDNAIIQRTAQDIEQEKPALSKDQTFQEAVDYWDRQRAKKIKLTFIGHSMGGLVVTNTVRILSDVFDTRSIAKQPSASIGYVFQLERLILASPDIPILTIVSNRANFLSSSLRRFTETYLFSSEGDIALRIASTAANYFTFPSATRSRGYRLGNVAIRPRNFDGQISSEQTDYGLVNLNSLTKYYEPSSVPLAKAIHADPDNILERLFITNINDSKQGIDSSNTPLSLATLFKEQGETENKRAVGGEQCTIADLFTFFDCTDYEDITDRSPNAQVGVLSRAKRKSSLSFLDYLELIKDYSDGSTDVHGGYFEGHFSKEAVYRLAFLGFDGWIQSFDQNDTQVALTKLHQTCQEKGIQLFLSPLRYRANIQGMPVNSEKAEIIADIRS
ncbi:MAG: alpha/beta hydrolase [Cyanobacteria bacterium P01_F01_bin.150]